MRRVVIGLVVGALALTIVAPGANADNIGDVSVPKGDIVTGTYTANFTDIFLTGFKARVTTAQGSNPTTTAAWLLPSTGLTVQLEFTNSHTGPDLSVVAHAVDDGGVSFVAEVTDLVADEPLVCGATATFTAPNVYKVVLPSGCLPGDAIKVKARFRMRWDSPPAGGTVTLDNSPNSGWGSLLQAPPQP